MPGLPLAGNQTVIPHSPRRCIHQRHEFGCGVGLLIEANPFGCNAGLAAQRSPLPLRKEHAPQPVIAACLPSCNREHAQRRRESPPLPSVELEQVRPRLLSDSVIRSVKLLVEAVPPGTLYCTIIRPVKGLVESVPP